MDFRLADGATPAAGGQPAWIANKYLRIQNASNDIRKIKFVSAFDAVPIAV